MRQDVVVRFAPSPNGLLHLGHAYAAIQAHDFARERSGRFLLRIEDIDIQRSRPEHVEAICDDLRWLGLQWDGPILFQSDRFPSYASAADELRAQGLLFPCFCSRADLHRALEEGRTAPGPDGPIYPGTCRDMPAAEAEKKMAENEFCWRLDVERALAKTGALSWHDSCSGHIDAAPQMLGDVILVPRHSPVSYHLAVTVDDARDGISDVVRGADLFLATHIHRLLQKLLDLPVPAYHHHRLLLDKNGEKLAKSRDSASLTILRKAGGDGIALAQDLRKNIMPVGITLAKD